MSDEAELTGEILRYLDGNLTQDEERALAQRIRGNADAERLLVRLSRLYANLPDVVRLMEARTAEQAGCGAVAQAGTAVQPDNHATAAPAGSSARLLRASRVHRPRRRRSWRTPAAFWTTAAMAASVVLVLAYVVMQAQQQTPDAVATAEGILGVIESVQSGGQANSPAIAHGNGKQELAQTGQKLRAGDRIETCRGVVRLRYAGEATILEAQEDTVVTLELADGAKLVRLARGELSATVAKQPTGKPMRFISQHAAATVLGTQLSLAVTADATWLEVQTGKVQLTRASDGKSVDVASGNFAVAGQNADLAARPIIKGPANVALKAKATASSTFIGEEGSPIRHTPDQGNDGEPATCWGSRDNHIASDWGAWWQVDLGVPCRINSVEVVARQDHRDQFAARANFEVRGSNNADGTGYVVLAKHEGPPFPQYGAWSANVSAGGPYRFIRLVQTKADYFGFAEFRAFGRPWSGRELEKGVQLETTRNAHTQQ